MTVMSTELANEQCVSWKDGIESLSADQIVKLHSQIHDDWTLDSEPAEGISRAFLFKNYYETMAFANAVAFIAHKQDHHPEMTISYKECQIHYSTHVINGLSRNDFICAAQIDRLIVE